jgi:signal transduction histidine kinase
MVEPAAARVGESAEGVVLLGPGARLASVAPLLRALATAIAPKLATGAPRVDALEDLARLLERRPGAGRLLLDADETASEDVGLVRRFLALHPAWSLCVLGQDGGRARALLALPRAQWMFWPPDLEQVRALLALPGSAESAASPAAHSAQMPAVPPGPAGAARNGSERGSEPAPALHSQIARLAEIALRIEQSFASLREASRLPEGPAERFSGELQRLRRFTRSLGALVAPPVQGREVFDLDALLEEQLAVLALRQRKAPRFKYRGGERLEVRADRAALTQALESLLLLARHCAAEGEVVRVQTSRADGDQLAIAIEFPAGPLDGLEPAEILAGAQVPEQLQEKLPEFDGSTLPAAAALFASQGGSLALSSPSRGSLTIHARLALVPAAESAAREPLG